MSWLAGCITNTSGFRFSARTPIAASPLGYIERMKALVVAILLALTMPASAQDKTTANQMLPGCKGLLDDRMTSGVSVYQQGRCGGYVASLVYGVGEQEFCSPKGVSIGQAVAVVIKYIEARPERMHEQFGKLATEALTAAWPCKR